MNILQITGNALFVGDKTTNGISRVVIQLSDYYVNYYHDVCFNAYLVGKEQKQGAVFTDNICISDPVDIDSLYHFLKEKRIDIIQTNLSADNHIKQIPKICDIAHSLNIKLVHCIHFMPGFESVSYGSIGEIRYSLTHFQPILDKIKKWIITIGQPWSASFIKKTLRSKYNDIYSSADKIVVFSEPYIDKYLSIVHGSNKKKFETIPNPLTFSKFTQPNDVKCKQKVVLLVSRLQEPQKRVSYALKIWKLVEQDPHLNDWKLSIVGSGKGEPFYHWLAKRYNLKRVCFEGLQDPRPYYERAAIFISTSGYEGWPMVLMEAMPMGCCCLSFDSYDAIHDIIEDGYDGRIIPNNDIKGYAKCLKELMSDEEKRITIGINAIESSHRFSMDIIGKRWHDLFEELTGKGC